MPFDPDLIAQRGWHTFENLMERGQIAGCVAVQGSHPLYIMYTSGTTGNPKGILRDTAGYMVALTWSMKHIYGLNPGKTFEFRSQMF